MISNRRADAVAALGVRVVGDPDTLRLPDDVPVRESEEAPPRLDADDAAEAVAAVLAVALRREKRLERTARAAAARATAQEGRRSTLGRVPDLGRRIARRLRNRGTP
jgi:hypothetical protein